MIAYMAMMDSESDRAKFKKIYLKYRHLMYTVACRIVRNRHDAEDAVHQAFVKIAEHIEEIEEPVCPKTRGYVVIIAENKAIDIYRRKQRHPVLNYEEEAAGMVIEYQGDNMLAACMAKLPARQREVILLKYRFGYSNEEVAGLMDTTVSNVLKTHQRAKQRLRELCEEESLI